MISALENRYSTSLAILARNPTCQGAAEDNIYTGITMRANSKPASYKSNRLICIVKLQIGSLPDTHSSFLQSVEEFCRQAVEPGQEYHCGNDIWLAAGLGIQRIPVAIEDGGGDFACAATHAGDVCRQAVHVKGFAVWVDFFIFSVYSHSLNSAFWASSSFSRALIPAISPSPYKAVRFFRVLTRTCYQTASRRPGVNGL